MSSSRGSRSRGGFTPLFAEVDLPVDASEYFVERDSAAFRALLAKALHLGQYRFGETWRSEGSTFVRLVTKPELASWVPAAVRNAVASAAEIEFHDVIEYRPSDISAPPYHLHIRTHSPFLGHKLHIETTLTFEALGAGACRQRLEGHVSVRLLGVGRLAEKIIRESVLKSYKRLPEVVAHWAAVRADAAARGTPGVLLAGRPPVGGDVAWMRELVQQRCNTSAQMSGKAPIEGAAARSAASAAADMEQAQDAGAAARSRSGGLACAVAESDSQAAAPGLRPPVPPLALSPALLPPAPHRRQHSRSASVDSVASSTGSDAPVEVAARAPGSRGARKAWRRFDRDFTAWADFWTVQRGAPTGLWAALRVGAWTLELMWTTLCLTCMALLKFGVVRAAGAPSLPALAEDGGSGRARRALPGPNKPPLLLSPLGKGASAATLPALEVAPLDDEDPVERAASGFDPGTVVHIRADSRQEKLPLFAQDEHEAACAGGDAEPPTPKWSYQRCRQPSTEMGVIDMQARASPPAAQPAQGSRRRKKLQLFTSCFGGMRCLSRE